MKKCIACLGVVLASMMLEAAPQSRGPSPVVREGLIRAPRQDGAVTNISCRATVGSTNVIDMAKLTDPELPYVEFLSATKCMGEKDLRKLCWGLRSKYENAARLNLAYSACDEYMTLLLFKIASQHSVDLRKAASDIDVMMRASKKKYDRGMSIGIVFVPPSTEAQRLEKIKDKSNMLSMRYMAEIMSKMAEKQDLLEQAKENVEAAKKNPKERASLLDEAKELLKKAESIETAP